MKTPARIAVVACAFAVSGALATLPFVLLADNVPDTAARLAPAAALAAAVLGVIVWETIVTPSRGRSVAAVAGALVGLGAHPLMWGIVALVVGTEVGATVEKQVMGSIVTAMLFGFFSVLAYGIVTIPMGALTGWLLGRVVRPDEATSMRHP